MNRDLILLTYAGFAAFLLLTGFVYKEVRDYRERRKAPKFNFEAKQPASTDRPAHDDRFVPTH